MAWHLMFAGLSKENFCRCVQQYISFAFVLKPVGG